MLLCLAALVATGLAAWRELPVEAFPDLTNNQVVVVTTAPGLAAPEVEQRITYPIETALMGTPGADQVRSISKFGLSIVTIVFEDRVPVYFARQLVSERLADVRGRLPQGAEPDARARWPPPSARSTSTWSRATAPTRWREDAARLGRAQPAAVGAGRERGELVGRPHAAVPRRGRPAAPGEIRPLAARRG